MIPSHWWVMAGRPAETYIQQLCADTGYSLEDLPGAMDNRDGWQERVREIHAGSVTWWWWFRYRSKFRDLISRQKKLSNNLVKLKDEEQLLTSKIPQFNDFMMINQRSTYSIYIKWISKVLWLNRNGFTSVIEIKKNRYDTYVL